MSVSKWAHPKQEQDERERGGAKMNGKKNKVFSPVTKNNNKGSSQKNGYKK